MGRVGDGERWGDRPGDNADNAGDTGDAATVVLTLDVRDGREREYQEWQERTNEAARHCPGFEAAELYPPTSADTHSWVVVFRFTAMEQLRSWLGSARRARLMDEGRDLFRRPAAQEILVGEPPDREVVTAVVSHRVPAGHEQAFVRWQEKMRRVQAASPGFLGYELFRPVPGVQDRWVAIFRYDSMRRLDEWLESPSRRRLLEDGRDHVDSFDVRKVGSSFSGWFRFGDGGEGGVPPNWKQAMMVLLALYPTVMVLTITVGRVLTDDGMSRYLVLFLGNVLSVSALTWVLMPLVNRLFARWLQPGRTLSGRRQILGAAAVLAGYAASLLIFGLTVG